MFVKMKNINSSPHLAKIIVHKMRSTDVKEISDEDDDVARFLKPLLVYLKCLGVPWARSKEDKQFQFRLSKIFLIRLFGWLLFLFNIGVYSDYTIEYSTFRNNDTTFTLTIVIIYANELFFKVINHLSLLFLSGSIKQIQLFQLLRELSYPGLKIRQLSGTMLLIFLMVSSDSNCKNNNGISINLEKSF